MLTFFFQSTNKNYIFLFWTLFSSFCVNQCRVVHASKENSRLIPDKVYYPSNNLIYNYFGPFEEQHPYILNIELNGDVGENVFWSFATNGNIGIDNHWIFDIANNQISGKPRICIEGACFVVNPEDVQHPFITYSGIDFYIDYLTNHISYYEEYTTILIAFVSAFILVAILIFISRLYPENANYSSSFEQNSSYECGFAPFGSLDKPQLFLFYKLAIFFIIFEAELIFLYPWVISIFASLGSAGLFFTSAIPFFIIICIGFYYEIDEEALDI